MDRTECVTKIGITLYEYRHQWDRARKRGQSRVHLSERILGEGRLKTVKLKGRT